MSKKEVIVCEKCEEIIEDGDIYYNLDIRMTQKNCNIAIMKGDYCRACFWDYIQDDLKRKDIETRNMIQNM